MQKIIETIIAYFPRFLRDLAVIFASPKAFIAGKDLDSDATFADALLFCATCAVVPVIVSVLHTNSGEKDTFIKYLMSIGMRQFLVLIFAGGAVWLSWRIVRGSASHKAIFTIYIYYSGVISSTFTRFRACAGYLKFMAPELYSRIRALAREIVSRPEQMKEFMEETEIAIAAYITISGWFCCFIWSIVSWGAYRRVSNSSLTRSVLAFSISTILLVPAYFIVGLMLSELK